MSAAPIKVLVVALPPVEIAGHRLTHAWALTTAGRWVGGGVSQSAERAVENCAATVAAKAPHLFGALNYSIHVVPASDPELRAAIETALERQP